jgi:hypothetical protein
MTLQRLGPKLLLVLLGLIGCMLLVIALLPYVVSLDSVRDQIVSRIEATLHRKVEVGAMRVGILSGLGADLKDVTIYNPPGWPGWQQPHVLKAATLSIKVAWRPLLQRRIEITKLILRDGEIVVERDAQGRLNLADAADAAPVSTQTLAADGSATRRGNGAPPGATPVAGLRVAEVTLQKMALTFVDRLIVPGQAVVTMVNDLQMHLRDVALGTPISLDVSATILTEGSRNVRLHGSIGPVAENLAVDSTPIDVQLETSDVRLDKLEPYLGRSLPLARGRLGGSAKVQGSMARGLRLSGQLSVADAVLRGGSMLGTSTALPTLTSTQAITVDLPAARAELQEVEINVAGIQALIKGVVHTFTTTPELDLQIATNTFSPAALLSQIPALARNFPSPTDVRGKVQLQGTVSGTPHDLRAETQLDLREVMLTSGSFNGGDLASGGMLVETDEAEARVATHVVKADLPRIHLDVRTQRLVFNRQKPSAPTPPPASVSGAQAGPATPTAPPPPMLPPVTLSGKLHIAEGRLQQLNVQQLTADFTLAQGHLKTTHQMSLYGGSSQGTTQVDLRQSEPSYTVETTVAGLNIGRALADLSGAKPTLLGVLDADMRLSGRGLAWEVVQKTLSSDGHVKIAEVQLTHVDPWAKLVPLLQNFSGFAGFTLPSGWERGSWRTIEADWRLSQGKILTDHLRLRREGMEALLSGYVGLDQTINYSGNLFLPAKIIGRRGGPLILRQDDTGRVMLPFQIKGMLSAPRLSLDEKALRQVATEELLDQVRKRFGGKIDELLGQPSTPPQPSQEPNTSEPETGERPRRPRWPEKILQELFRR